MTQKEKQLLQKDLSARLPYGVKCSCIHEPFAILSRIDVEDQTVYYRSCDEWESIEYCKPYLRPMSSMTEEEYKEYDWLIRMSVTVAIPPGASIMKPEYIVDIEDDGDGLNHLYDWLLEHHFDYRGLIPMGLALEAPEDMYKTE